MHLRFGRYMGKRYRCLFLDVSFVAIHIEVTHSMSTQAFMPAFVETRGRPKLIMSGNSCNFKGVYNELRVFIPYLLRPPKRTFWL